MNNHPLRDNPNAPLFVKENGEGYRSHGFHARVRRLTWQILRKRVSPKIFRHTKATEDSRYFTDREMMKLFGWKRPETVGVYSHLSMRDVEEKDLVLHGLKPREEILKPLTQVVRCSTCKQENAPVALYCVKCGSVLRRETADAAPEDVWAALKAAASKDLREFLKLAKGPDM